MMPDLKTVKEISRGVDWVKFLAIWKPGTTFDEITACHGEWATKYANDFNCEVIAVLPFNFGDSAAIFKFKTEPYSMEVNDFYRYIDAFDKYLRGTTSNGSEAPDAAKDVNAKPYSDPYVDDYAKKLADKLIGGIFDSLLGNPADISKADLFSKKPEDSCVLVGDPSEHTVTVKQPLFTSDDVSTLTKPKFRTTNDIHVKSLISRIKNH